MRSRPDSRTILADSVVWSIRSALSHYDGPVEFMTDLRWHLGKLCVCRCDVLQSGVKKTTRIYIKHPSLTHVYQRWDCSSFLSLSRLITTSRSTKDRHGPAGIIRSWRLPLYYVRGRSLSYTATNTLSINFDTDQNGINDTHPQGVLLGISIILQSAQMSMRNTSGKFSIPFGRKSDSKGPSSPTTTGPSHGRFFSGSGGGGGGSGDDDFGPSGNSGGVGSGGLNLGKRIAHQSFLPGLGNQDLRQLQE